MPEQAEHIVDPKPERAATPLNGPDHMRAIRRVLGTQRDDPRSYVGKVLAKVFAQRDAQENKE